MVLTRAPENGSRRTSLSLAYPVVWGWGLGLLLDRSCLATPACSAASIDPSRRVSGVSRDSRGIVGDSRG